MSVGDITGSFRGRSGPGGGLLARVFQRRAPVVRRPMAGDPDLADARDTVRRRLILSNVQLVAASLAASGGSSVAGSVAADIETLLGALERAGGRPSRMRALKRDLDVVMERVRPDLSLLRDRLAAAGRGGEAAGVEESLSRIHGELAAVLAHWARRRR